MQQTMNTQKSAGSSLTMTSLFLANDGDCHVPCSSGSVSSSNSSSGISSSSDSSSSIVP